MVDTEILVFGGGRVIAGVTRRFCIYPNFTGLMLKGRLVVSRKDVEKVLSGLAG